MDDAKIFHCAKLCVMIDSQVAMNRQPGRLVRASALSSLASGVWSLMTRWNFNMPLSIKTKRLPRPIPELDERDLQPLCPGNWFVRGPVRARA